MITIQDEMDQLLYDEMKSSFLFLYEYANKDESSTGYGLTLDVTKKLSIASIASVGFLLGGISIAIDENWITKEEGRKFVSLTTDTFLNHVDSYQGMFAHFVDMKTGKRFNKCEFSTIDTMLFLAGLLCNMGLFDSEVDQKINDLLLKANYSSYILKKEGGSYSISMGYNAEHIGRPGVYDNGFLKHSWNHFAEQLALYFIIAGHPEVEPELARNLYYSMEKSIGSYKSDPFIFSSGNALFIHQYSHCFVDFEKYVDGHEYDWFKNSVSASIANYNYCIDYKHSKTYSKYLWGTTACLSPKGYVVNGSKPNNLRGATQDLCLDGTFAPCGPLGSIVFVPNLVKETINYIEQNHPDLKGRYGYYDALNLDEGVVVKEYLGIDKGATLLMLANYFSRSVWNRFMNTEWIQRAIKGLEFRAK